MVPPRPHRGPRRERRRQARRSRGARRTAIFALLAVAFLLTLVLAAFGSSSSNERSVPASAARLAPPGRPLPQVVATQGSLHLQMPISQRDVTAIGYHGAGEDALPLDPVGRQTNQGVFSRMFHWIFGGGGDELRYYQLSGGDGPSTGGLDVGAVAGADVYAPVEGTVVSVRDYVLDGRRYGDVIEIQPTGAPSVIVTATHLRADPALTVGSPVGAVTTKIGVVLDLSSVEEQALARHTGDAGNHVTLEVHPAASLSLR